MDRTERSPAAGSGQSRRQHGRQDLEAWFCPQPWNKPPDATLRAVADTGGVIGISAVRRYLSSWRGCQPNLTNLDNPLQHFGKFL